MSLHIVYHANVEGYVIINFPKLSRQKAHQQKTTYLTKTSLSKLIAMDPKNKSLTKTLLIAVAISYLLYTIYQAITTTLFVIHFPTVIIVLPTHISSSHPSLQLGLFLLQEIAGSAGSYIRLVGALIAVYCAFNYFRNDPNCLGKFRLVLLLESLYFLLLLPAAANHLVGSIISTSTFLNFYTGVSTLLQAVLIFPPLFMLSRKLKSPQNLPSVQKWVCIAAPLYVCGFWVRHGLLWVYALSSSAPLQEGFFEAVGFVNSWLTLLVAAIVTTVTGLVFWKNRKLNMRFVGVAIISVGVYFAIYFLVSVWLPIYRAFLPLTDFWMLTLPLLGIAILLNDRCQRNNN